MKTYLDIIEDTVEYYSTHNRGLFYRNNEPTGCAYINDKGDMCAIGRYAKDPQALEDIAGDLSQICDWWLDPDDDEDLNLYTEDYNTLLRSEILKEEVNHLGNYDFWNELQKFHDYKDNWYQNNKGGWSLTESGQKEYIDLLETDWD